MRDGNPGASRLCVNSVNGFRLPMRDGNQFVEFLRSLECQVLDYL